MDGSELCHIYLHIFSAEKRNTEILKIKRKQILLETYADVIRVDTKQCKYSP
jgi:hypothetical protein